MRQHAKMVSPDEVSEFFRVRLSELRLAARMSQALLAESMSERGFHWHQTTVHRIESGRQEAAFNEVTALSEIFGVPLRSFSPPRKAAS